MVLTRQVKIQREVNMHQFCTILQQIVRLKQKCKFVEIASKILIENANSFAKHSTFNLRAKTQEIIEEEFSRKYN